MKLVPPAKDIIMVLRLVLKIRIWINVGTIKGKTGMSLKNHPMYKRHAYLWYEISKLLY